MRPLVLRIQGLRSWRSEQTIDLSDVSLVAIIGDTGAGKSSLLEALTYALYGGSTWDPKGVRALISDGESTMRVELVFRAEGKKWTVTRTTSRGSYPPSLHRLVSEDGARFDKAADVSREIERLVGLDYEAFLRAVVLPQGRFALLLQATDTDRSAILKGIFRLDELDRARARAEETLRRLRELAEQLGARRVVLLPDPAGAAEDAATRLAASEVAERALGLAHRRITAEHEEARKHRDLSAKSSEHQGALTRARVDDAAPRLEALNRSTHAAEERARTLETQEADARADEASRLSALSSVEERVGGATTLATARALVKQALEEEPRLARTLADIDAELSALGLVEAEQRERTALVATHGAQVTEQEQALLHKRERSAERTTALADSRATLRRLRETQQAEKKEESRQNELKIAREESTQRARAAEVTLEQTRARLLAARESLEREEQRDHAARAAHGAAPGDPCPVCARPLPEGFAAPEQGPVEALRSELREVETAAQTALGAFERARADAAAKADAAARVEQELGEVRARLAAEKSSATALLGEVDLRKKDATLLAVLEAEVATLRAGLLADERALTEARKLEAEVRTALTLEAKRIAERRRSVAARQVELGERRSRLVAQLADLPGELATTLDTVALAETLAFVEAHEAELRSLDEALRAARRRLDEALTARRALDAAIAADRSELAQLVQRLTNLAVRVADAQRFVGAQTIDEAPLGPSALDAARFAGAVTGAAASITEHLGLELAESARVVEGARRRIAEILAEAGVADEGGLDRRIVDVRADATRARADHERAVRERPLAERIDARAHRLGALIAALEEVRGKLSDAKFVKFVVAERQKALLATASELLGAMTGGRFGFAASFEVVDRLSGQPRSPKTLSGGETFVASLALALGLVELAGRSGGRLEALFLDEGFGSLDANSLGEALAVLGEQATGGRLVAVISHLRSVAETIDDVLSVRRGPKGSEAVWLRGEGREALAAKEMEDALLG